MFRSAMPRRAVSIIFWLAVLVWAGGVLWLSSISHDDLPRTAFATWDKLNHFAAFAVGGWLTASALRLTRPEAPVVGWFVFAVLLIAAFGAFDEFVQLSSPGRSGADPYDWIADSLGAIAGASLTLVTHARLERLIARP